MRRANAYRYFLCFLPDDGLRQEIATLHRLTGQHGNRVPAERSHLSLCVFGAPPVRDPFLLRRVDAALAGKAIASCAVRLGRARGGPDGATLFTRGSKRDLTALRRCLLALLAGCELVPALEKNNPHITLGYDPCRAAGFDIALEWIPREVVLIESEHGLGRHNRLASWPLLQPAQGVLPFGSQPDGPERAS